jgi:predicted transcriptional regulator
MLLTGLHDCIYGRRMDDLLTPADIERLAREAGISLADACRRAGIAQSTFSRWKAGKTEPTLGVYRRLRDAVMPAPAAQEAA